MKYENPKKNIRTKNNLNDSMRREKTEKQRKKGAKFIVD